MRRPCSSRLWRPCDEHNPTRDPTCIPVREGDEGEREADLSAMNEYMFITIRTNTLYCIDTVSWHRHRYYYTTS